MSKGLDTLVEKLRQEQEFVSFYKQQIRQSVQDLNSSCDQVFHSLWLSHTLSYGLHRVLTHNSHAYEWSRALSCADRVSFVNASKGVKSHLFVDRYSRFLTRLLNDPNLLSGILTYVENEGLDCSWVVNDLMSVLFGHCMFKKDHTLYLELMRELLRQHIEKCDSPKDLFGGVESVFNHALSEYCSQLVELRTFLTTVLQEPIMQVLTCEEHLEFDVTKAGNRFQRASEQHCNGFVSPSSASAASSSSSAGAAFLFNEDLELSCQKLARLASQFLENLTSMSPHFPVTLRWLLGNLKAMVRQKWPHITPTDLRRPISDAIFSSILSSAVVNPDRFGVVDPSLIISEVGRYNLAQIMSVLQGCVWIMGKPNSAKYPIQKVVRRMDVNLFFSLVDGIDSGLTGTMPDLPSFLPGVHRSAFLASLEQLDNLVGLVAMLVTNRTGTGKFHSSVSGLLSCLLPAMIEQASHNPYPITTKPSLLLSPPPPSSSAATETERNKSLVRKRGGKKGSMGSLEMLDVGGSPSQQQRSRGMTNQQTTPDKKLKRSFSSDAGFSELPAAFRLPEQVLVFPVLEKLVEEGVAQWDFYLLTEEEFMGQSSPSPGPKADDKFYFNSFLRSHSVPCTLDLTTPTTPSLDLNTPPMMAAGMRNSEQAELRVANMVRSKFAARGRVKSMISDIEGEGERGRSNTLPIILSSPTNHATSSAGGSPTNYATSAGGSATSAGGSPTNYATSAGVSPTPNGRLQHTHLAGQMESSPGCNGDLIEGGSQPVISHNGGALTAVHALNFAKEPRKLSTTFETSMEDSASYVKLHPPAAVATSAVLPEEEEGGEARRKGSRTEEVFVSLVAQEGVVREGSYRDTRSLDMSEEDRGHTKSLSSTPPPLLDYTSDELGGGQNDSLHNLYEGEEGGAPQAGKDKQKKKRKWKLFRKRKSTEDQVVVKSGRSQSDAPLKSQRVISREEAPFEKVQLRDKMRSISHSTFLPGDGGRDLGDGGRGPGKANRYTVYMQDYSAKLEERKRLITNHEGAGLSTSQGSGLDEVDRGSTEDVVERAGSATPPAEMTPMTFKQSLFCSQLKYKLRSALQNIHVPLSLSPAFQQLRLKGDARYQLIVLIQHALQRTRWAQNDMETALLTEILRMVEPLPSHLIQVTIDGVLEGYHLRSSYIAYLVCSQQKFQDAKLQVAAVQEAIERIMHINTKLFVNFAVRMFLEASSGQPRLSELGMFSQQMARLFLADEKCSLMNDFLLQCRTALHADTLTWELWQGKEVVSSCLSDYLFTCVYHHVFYPNGGTDKEVDKIFSDHLAALSKSISMTHSSLQIPFVYHSGCPWVASQKQLKIMAAHKSPRGKLRCIVQSLRVLISLLQYARCGDPPGADDLFPVLVYVLIKANPPSVLSTCQYIRNFAEASLQGEEAYWWAQFSTAVEFTKTLS